MPVLKVGTSQAYASVSAAHSAASDDDVIELYEGAVLGTTPLYLSKSLTINNIDGVEMAGALFFNGSTKTFVLDGVILNTGDVINSLYCAAFYAAAASSLTMTNCVAHTVDPGASNRFTAGFHIQLSGDVVLDQCRTYAITTSVARYAAGVVYRGSNTTTIYSSDFIGEEYGVRNENQTGLTIYSTFASTYSDSGGNAMSGSHNAATDTSSTTIFTDSVASVVIADAYENATNGDFAKKAGSALIGVSSAAVLNSADDPDGNAYLDPPSIGSYEGGTPASAAGDIARSCLGLGLGLGL